jgi:glutamate synthase (NADPH/NADH) large chain
VGVCVQDERLRAKFTGTPDKVINLFTFIAEEVREILASLGLRSLEEAVGRTDLLHQVSRGGAHLDDLDLNPLLVRVALDPKATITPADQINAVADTLDAKIVKDAAFLLDRGEKMQLTYDVRNTMRAVGTRTSSAIVSKYGDTLDEGHLTLELSGSAGQSLGAFAVKGLTINLIGEANDYVGKGLSGAVIVVRPKVWHENQALAGNTILYGATSGQLYIAGTVGERFPVRNSGATTVVEGVGAHGCEYMTGGEVVILGRTGSNFGAGMTGGVAWVYDPDGQLASHVNPESITLRPVHEANVARLKTLIRAHLERTLSPKAQAMLDDWDQALAAFVEVMPNEILAIQKKAEAKIA